MNRLEANWYQQFRNSGMSAANALRATRIYVEWQIEYGAGHTRLRCEEEQENYFDVYGEPEGYTNIHGRRISAEKEREEISRQIELNGCVCVISEYWDGEDWQHADSVGMCVGYQDAESPLQNWYVPDLMEAAIEAYKAQALVPPI